ncbi:hypothetical protein L198_00349 [Cryptococcus wingfieldii CBS 7118]|uniref:mRNA export factor GLE1 n=1 Tax=Cryptococcus wingfieldii CBS 7118 TaxID=1295528 RepID=A0A1E3K7X2_9TREE|nr:hypothetical protein L198_00349 [Cryptococcus wingfieldii CBS 7118]ODO08617.1 hypothetical protein L198_00349 [Cryptococcus wingfieldii CBS 7118]
MRFALEDVDSDSDYDILAPVHASVYSDDDDDSLDGLEWVNTQPRSSLGRSLRAALDSSDDETTASDGSIEFIGFGGRSGKGKQRETDHELDAELDSEDEVEFMGFGPGPSRPRSGMSSSKSSSKSQPWNVFGSSSQKKSVSRSHAPALLRNSLLTRSATSIPSKTKTDLADALRDEDGYEGWVKKTELDAWRDNQRRVALQRSQIRDISSNARQKIQSLQQVQMSREAEEMSQMLEGLVIRHRKEEEELQRTFKEREKALWEDIDGVIKAAEKQYAEAEARAAADAQAVAKKEKEEQDAKIAAAERLALAQKAEVERRAKELALKEQQARSAKEAEERQRQEAEEKAQLESRRRDKKGEAGAMWRQYVEKQQWMKSEVIEAVKADKPTMTALNKSKRMMTRWLGQTLNTKESVTKITNDIHDILVQHLPTLPTTASPIVLNNDIPRPYAYLLSHISKVLISQAQSEITSKPASAYPLGKIVYGLMLRGHAALGDILFARFVKKCPWVVPFYPARQPNQSREEYEQSTGRGTDESSHEYISRMSSLSTLFFAILQTPIPSLISTLPTPLPTPQQLEQLIPVPMRLSYAWTWMALALRDPMPASPPIATLVTTWLEIALAECISVYGRIQTDKIREVLEREGLQGGGLKGDGGMALDKLEFVLDRWRKGDDMALKGKDWAA